MAIKIFEMSDMEWVAAPSKFSALRWYMKQTGLRKLDLEDDMDHPAEVSESELDRLQFFEDHGSKKSFRVKLAELQKEGVKFPCIFAMVDY